LSQTPGKEPTPRELEILKVLWEQGPSSVRGVHQQMITDEPELAFNTVQTMLRLMEGKGLVDHVEDGRSFVYTARFSRDDTAKRFLERVFDGVASQLVLSLLRSQGVSNDELDRMQSMIGDAQRQKRDGKGGGR
jgi:BlaI family transcriptional regulator, penicillinase repressor